MGFTNRYAGSIQPDLCSITHLLGKSVAFFTTSNIPEKTKNGG